MKDYGVFWNNCFKIIKTESRKERVIKVPENMTIYFIQITPVHIKYKPPNVSSTDSNGSTIKKILTLCLSFVIETIRPNKKKMRDMDKICECCIFF